MGLVNHHQSFITPAVTNRLNGCIHFRRVVTIVIHQHYVANRGSKLSQHLETPVHTIKTTQAFGNHLIRNTFISSRGKRGQSIQYVMSSRNTQFNGNRRLFRMALFRIIFFTIATANQVKRGSHALLANIHRPVIGVFTETLGNHLSFDFRQQFPDHGTVDTDNGHPVKRQIVQEINKCLFQLAKVTVVGCHMVCINIW